MESNAITCQSSQSHELTGGWLEASCRGKSDLVYITTHNQASPGGEGQGEPHAMPG